MAEMKKTTLCYIKNNGCYLMLYRNRKLDDPNEGKWLGIGGKFETGESPDACNAREVLEEAGLRLKSAHFHGVIHFRADAYEDEDMYLYSSDDFEPADLGERAIFEETGNYEPPECDEGELRWVAEEDLMRLPMWEGDRIFLEKIIAGQDRITMTLNYVGDHCTVVEDSSENMSDNTFTIDEICELFIRNRTILHDAFRWEGEEMHRLGSSLLTARHEEADAERLKVCEQILKENSGILSIFRGQLKMAALCNMARQEEPAEYIRKVEYIYKMLKSIKGSDNSALALAAITIAEFAETEDALVELVENTKSVYSRLREDKNFKSLGNSYLVATMLAILNIEGSQSENFNQAIDEFIDRTYKCRESLQDLIPKRALNTLSMLIAIDSQNIENRCDRVRTLHNFLKNAGIKIGGGNQDAVLAGLTLLNKSDEEIVESVLAADAFLKEQKGFGILGTGKEGRHMYASLLVVDAFIPGNEMSNFTAAGVVDAAVNSQLVAMNTQLMAVNTIMLTTSINLMIQNEAIISSANAGNING